MADAQLNDPEIGRFVKIFKERDEPFDWDELIHEDKYMKTYHQQWDSMKLLNGVLYRRFESANNVC